MLIFSIASSSWALALEQVLALLDQELVALLLLRVLLERQQVHRRRAPRSRSRASLELASPAPRVSKSSGGGSRRPRLRVHRVLGAQPLERAVAARRAPAPGRARSGASARTARSARSAAGAPPPRPPPPLRAPPEAPLQLDHPLALLRLGLDAARSSPARQPGRPRPRSRRRVARAWRLLAGAGLERRLQLAARLLGARPARLPLALPRATVAAASRAARCAAPAASSRRGSSGVHRAVEVGELRARPLDLALERRQLRLGLARRAGPATRARPRTSRSRARRSFASSAPSPLALGRLELARQRLERGAARVDLVLRRLAVLDQRRRAGPRWRRARACSASIASPSSASWPVSSRISISRWSRPPAGRERRRARGRAPTPRRRGSRSAAALGRCAASSGRGVASSTTTTAPSSRSTSGR